MVRRRLAWYALAFPPAWPLALTVLGMLLAWDLLAGKKRMP